MKKRRLKLKVKRILFLLLIIVFLFSTIKVLLFLKDLSVNKNDNKKLEDEVVNTTVNNEEKITRIDFDKLFSINNETVGWIKFNEDKINNPIVKTKDNSFYLNHAFDKSKNQAGTIFMDYRNLSFDDRNVVLFGHAMLDNTMFGSISDVFDKDFFEKKDNNYIEIINTNNETLTYQIFSYYVIEKEEYYITTSFNGEHDFATFIDTIKKRSYKDFNIDVTTTDYILTLSTCSGVGNTTKRKVIHAKRVNF